MNSKKIYVACPAGYATGGPELLHQLVYKINKLGYNAELFYINKTTGTPTPERYKKYITSYTYKIEDNKNNILIVPEIATGLLYNYKNVKKIIWWLSVDNYLKYDSGYFKNSFLQFDNYYTFKDNIPVQHLYQSHYAYNFLMSKGISVDKMFRLQDYLDERMLYQTQCLDESKKKNYIAYNKKKMGLFTEKIINKSKSLIFKPISGMSCSEVKTLLRSSKVYIDFGNHPGRDRLPREAAMCGCCIITGRQGSAKFQQDIQIPEKYKLEDTLDNADNILKMIHNCIDNYSKEIKNFQNYRDEIKIEEKVFESDILKVLSTNK